MGEKGQPTRPRVRQESALKQKIGEKYYSERNRVSLLVVRSSVPSNFDCLVVSTTERPDDMDSEQFSSSVLLEVSHLQAKALQSTGKESRHTKWRERSGSSKVISILHLPERQQSNAKRKARYYHFLS